MKILVLKGNEIPFDDFIKIIINCMIDEYPKFSTYRKAKA